MSVILIRDGSDERRGARQTWLARARAWLWPEPLEHERLPLGRLSWLMGWAWPSKLDGASVGGRPRSWQWRWLGLGRPMAPDGENCGLASWRRERQPEICNATFRRRQIGRKGSVTGVILVAAALTALAAPPFMQSNPTRDSGRLSAFVSQPGGGEEIDDVAGGTGGTSGGGAPGSGAGGSAPTITPGPDDGAPTDAQNSITEDGSQPGAFVGGGAGSSEGGGDLSPGGGGTTGGTTGGATVPTSLPAGFGGGGSGGDGVRPVGGGGGTIIPMAELGPPGDDPGSGGSRSDNFDPGGGGDPGGDGPGPPAAVPEPATWAMMIMGFGAVGYAIRRQRFTVTAAS